LEVAHPVDDEAVESALDCNINNLHTALHHTHHTNSALPCPACACHLPSLILTFTYASLHAFNTCLAVELKMCSLAIWDHVSAVSPPAMMCLDLLSTTCYFSCTAAIQAERAPSSRHSCKSKAMQPVTDSHISGNQILADLVYKTECRHTVEQVQYELYKDMGQRALTRAKIQGRTEYMPAARSL